MAALTAPPPVAGGQIQLIHPDRLKPHPKNPRPPLSAAAVADLLPRIQAQGQQEPCLVRRLGEFDGFQLIFGHRRTFVAGQLGRDVPCIVVDLEDAQAHALLLSSDQAPKDPLLEAEAVEALLAQNGRDVKKVAGLMGRTARWVAQRANLRTLSPKVLEARADPETPVSKWTVAMLEQFARLAPEAQDKLLERVEREYDHTPMEAEDLEDLLADATQELGKASWDLDDAKLVPKAGACATCPKTSLRSPGLFDDGLEPIDVSKAVCRDRACWDAKLAANSLVQIKKLREQNPGAVVVRDGYTQKNPALPRGAKALSTYQVDESTKSDPKAVPALYVKDNGMTVTKYVIPRPQPAPYGQTPKKSEPETPAEKLKASKKEIAERRETWFRNEFAQSFRDNKIETPAERVVRQLVAAYGAMDLDGSINLAARKKAAATEGAAWAKLLWPRIMDAIHAAIGYGPHAEDEIAWLAELLKIDLDVLEEKARVEIPDPGWWSKPEPAAKKAAKKKPAGPAPKGAKPDVKKLAANDRDEDDETPPLFPDKGEDVYGGWHRITNAKKAKPLSEVKKRIDEWGELVFDEEFTKLEGLYRSLENDGWEPEVQTCMRCGCTEENGCPAGCSWSKDSLCSACEKTPGAGWADGDDVVPIHATKPAKKGKAKR